MGRWDRHPPIFGGQVYFNTSQAGCGDTGEREGNDKYAAVKISIWVYVKKENHIWGERKESRHKFSPTNASYPQISTSYPQN